MGIRQANLGDRLDLPSSAALLNKGKMSANLAMYTSLSLLGLCALAGAGVGVGSGVAMMTMQMMEAEEQAKAGAKPTAAASPVERVKVNARAMSFAASGIKQN